MATPAPRIVRNFWIVADATGVAKPLGFGPNTSKEGGFNLTVFQRHKGDVKTAAHIRGVPRDGTLELLITPGDFPFERISIKTERD